MLPPFEDDILSLDPPPRFPWGCDRIDPESASATGYLGFLSLAARRDIRRVPDFMFSRFHYLSCNATLLPLHSFVADADTYNMYDAL